MILVDQIIFKSQESGPVLCLAKGVPGQLGVVLQKRQSFIVSLVLAASCHPISNPPVTGVYSSSAIYGGIYFEANL